MSIKTKLLTQFYLVNEKCRLHQLQKRSYFYEKPFLRFTIFALVFSLLFAMPVPAGASEFNNDSEVILGSDADISGYLVENDEDTSKQSRVLAEPSVPVKVIDSGGYTYYSIFSITANEVTKLLTSNVGGKTFSISSLPSDANYILCTGTLNHSLYEEVHISVPFMYGGICYYGYNYLYEENTYISVFSVDAEPGVQAEGKFKISDYLTRNVTYYSYVKNNYPAGYVYGTWEIYYSRG